MAEGEGFEPPEGANPQRFSRPPQSTALPPLQVGADEGDFLAAFAGHLNGPASIGVGRVLGVENFLHFREMRLELLPVALPFLGGLFGDGRAHHVQLLAR